MVGPLPRSKARRQRSISLPLGLICLAVALVIGLLVALASSIGSGEPAALNEVEPARVVDGVRVGFAHSRSGVAEAEAGYQQALAAPAVLRSGTLMRRIRVIATPRYAARMLTVNSPGQRRLAMGPLGGGVREGVRSLFCMVPIGYRIESYTPQRARVLSWGFTMLGNATSVAPEAYFGLSQTELVWRDGWRIASVRSGFGPTPKIETPPGTLGGFDLIDLARRLHDYELAP